MNCLEGDELALLHESEQTHEILKVTVKGCAYSCCGRGWRRRDYEAEYVGYVTDFKHEGVEFYESPIGHADVAEVVGRGPVTFLLVSPGLGTVSYTIAVREWEVELVERRG